jgi:aspartate/methionine/tyrosine aminotransferase
MTFAMNIEPFALERYFARYEFSVPYLLSSSDCDGWPMSEIVGLADAEALELWHSLRLGYTDSLGHPLLRQEVANLYQGVHPNQVLVVTPEEGIYLVMNCLLEKGDHVICTFPGYQSLYQLAASLGCQVTRWEPEENAGWHFNPEFLRRSIRPITKLIVWNFPHNPTGFLPTRADFQSMMAIAHERKVRVFADEMYWLLEVDRSQRLPSAVEVSDDAIVLFGMSKSFGLAGARIGWLVTKDADVYTKLVAFRDYTTICSSAPSEILALIALRARDTILARHRERITNNLALLDDFFERHRQLLTWGRPKAGTVCFPRLQGGRSSSDLADRLATRAGIMILPSRVYGYDDAHFRLGFGRANLPEVLTQFESSLPACL